MLIAIILINFKIFFMKKIIYNVSPIEYGVTVNLGKKVFPSMEVRTNKVLLNYIDTLRLKAMIEGYHANDGDENLNIPFDFINEVVSNFTNPVHDQLINPFPKHWYHIMRVIFDSKFKLFEIEQRLDTSTEKWSFYATKFQLEVIEHLSNQLLYVKIENLRSLIKEIESFNLEEVDELIELFIQHQIEYALPPVIIHIKLKMGRINKNQFIKYMNNLLFLKENVSIFH